MVCKKEFRATDSGKKCFGEEMIWGRNNSGRHDWDEMMGKKVYTTVCFVLCFFLCFVHASFNYAPSLNPFGRVILGSVIVRYLELI